ncbi:MAG: IS21 family transposase [Elusimicrobia bacterium]|jgi:transposase|nr:IS21 family transposase [Elusimicrobiota bacterium]
MLGAAMYTTIKTLWKRHKNKSKIARLTGHDWKTVAKVIDKIEHGEECPAKKPHPRLLDPYREQIMQWMEADLTAVRMHEKLKEMGVTAGYSTVKDYRAAIRGRKNIFVRMHTPPGEEAQVDFVYVGLTPDNNGKRRKTWVFNMRLSYSRLDYYEKVYDQCVETFIRCHINAFNYFGGVPEYVKIDNLKAAILKANFYEPVYQRQYKDFADYYDFNPLPCRVRDPNGKGKVESGIKYVKINFFAGRKFKDEDDLDRQLRNWLDNTCNQRVHGTTRKIPRELFESTEKDELRTLPREEYSMSQMGTRKVYHDCHIYVGYNYYSVPFKYVGKEVEIEQGKELLKIYYQGKQIALHTLLKGQGRFSTVDSHYPKYKRYSETEYQEKYQVKMAELGEYAQQLFFLIIEKKPRDWSRNVQGILSLTKTYPEKIVNLACKRALAYDVHNYSVVKNICCNSSYNMPGVNPKCSVKVTESLTPPSILTLQFFP